MITDVALFVSDIGFAETARQHGSAIIRVPPRSTISTADAALGLGGALIEYIGNRSIDWENVPRMNDQEWSRFLNTRFPGKSWRRWFGKTPSAIYSVVVIESG